MTLNNKPMSQSAACSDDEPQGFEEVEYTTLCLQQVHDHVNLSEDKIETLTQQLAGLKVDGGMHYLIHAAKIDAYGKPLILSTHPTANCRSVRLYLPCIPLYSASLAEPISGTPSKRYRNLCRQNRAECEVHTLKACYNVDIAKRNSNTLPTRARSGPNIITHRIAHQFRVNQRSAGPTHLGKGNEPYANEAQLALKAMDGKGTENTSGSEGEISGSDAVTYTRGSRQETAMEDSNGKAHAEEEDVLQQEDGFWSRRSWRLDNGMAVVDAALRLPVDVPPCKGCIPRMDVGMRFAEWST